LTSAIGQNNVTTDGKTVVQTQIAQQTARGAPKNLLAVETAMLIPEKVGFSPLPKIFPITLIHPSLLLSPHPLSLKTTSNISFSQNATTAPPTVYQTLTAIPPATNALPKATTHLLYHQTATGPVIAQHAIQTRSITCVTSPPPASPRLLS